MARGFCARCGREIGGRFKPTAWQCLRSKGIYCDDCPSEKVGWLSKKAVCPECRIEMQEGGIPSLANSGWTW